MYLALPAHLRRDPDKLDGLSALGASASVATPKQLAAARKQLQRNLGDLYEGRDRRPRAQKREDK